MGIGNTTPSAAIAAALAGGETAAWVGRGTGVDDEGLARKRAAVQESVRRIAGITDPIEILREVGGAELVAVAAADDRRPPSIDPGRARRLRGHRRGAAAVQSPTRPRSTTAPSGTARPNRVTAGCWNGWASDRCSTSTCASARARARWRRCR